MIARLHGRLTEKTPNRIVIDVQGVGYEVHIPLSTFYGLGEPGSTVALRVHTHVREDALALFGFATGLELQLFERLIGVTGIGPRLALAVLSGIEPDDLIRAIRQADVARLTAIPGVGKKTAERISLELRDRLATLGAAGPLEAGRAAGADGDLAGDVLSALLNLGYHRPLAERALRTALAAEPDQTFENVLRRVLKEISRQ